MNEFEQPIFQEKLAAFLAEDLGTGDLTSPVLPERLIKGSFLVKQAGVVAGQAIPAAVYQLLGSAQYTPLVADGTQVSAGTIIGSVVGPAQEILIAERLILNLMQRMSGIATATAQAVQTLDDPQIKILDTRKTAPGLRIFDKQAVVAGGGFNHRMGLYDLAMFKDNHWKLLDDLVASVHEVRKLAGPTKLVEVEVESHHELTRAIEADADIIMIDNQTLATVKLWCQEVPDHIKVEVSGGITPTTLADYQNSGVDFISLGYLTNAVQNLDISFNLR